MDSFAYKSQDSLDLKLSKLGLFKILKEINCYTQFRVQIEINVSNCSFELHMSNQTCDKIYHLKSWAHIPVGPSPWSSLYKNEAQRSLFSSLEIYILSIHLKPSKFSCFRSLYSLMLFCLSIFLIQVHVTPQVIFLLSPPMIRLIYILVGASVGLLLAGTLSAEELPV